LRGIVKRGRKYYLGVTTITQDVDDFLETAYGKEIVTNSAIQILLKQHSAAINQIGEVFYLSEGEKQLLLSANKGEGIFFAGQNHVAIQVIASEDEHRLITSNPEDVLRKQNQNPPKPFPNPSLDRAGQNPSKSPFDLKGDLKQEEKKVEVVPKINIPEIKTVEIEETLRPAGTSLDREAIQKPVLQNPSKPFPNPSLDRAGQINNVDLKNESVLFRKPEVVVLQNPSVPTAVGTATLDSEKIGAGAREPLKLETNKPMEIKVEEARQEIKKPIFIRTEEEKIPQPPQLNKTPQPVFEKDKKPEDSGKMDYDKLFGDGIV